MHPCTLSMVVSIDELDVQLFTGWIRVVMYGMKKHSAEQIAVYRRKNEAVFGPPIVKRLEEPFTRNSQGSPLSCQFPVGSGCACYRHRCFIDRSV